MKLFELHRDEDETGVSGTGVVAQGVIFDNGRCSLTWLTAHTSVATYDSIADVIAIHSHGGKTRVVQIANVDSERSAQLWRNAYQDEIENVGVDFTEKHNHREVWKERGELAAMFRPVDLTRDDLRVRTDAPVSDPADPSFRLFVSHELFSGFAYDLVHEERFTGHQLLGVVEEPWEWTPEFLVWLANKESGR